MAKNASERRRKAEERRKERERAERRARILRVTAFAGAGVLFAGMVGFGIWVAYERGAGDAAASVEASDIENLQTYDGLTNQHVAQPVDYEMTPPAGGDHHAVWQNCGVYGAPISSLNAVHSLEHGAVWITYSPDLADEQVEELESLYSQGSYIIVSPYDEQDMPAPIVASAWGNQIEVQSPGDERLSQFLRSFERSPDVPEPGAACTQGLDLNAQELEEAGGIEALGQGMQR